MKKLQILSVLILSLFFVLSCSINDDDDLVDTYSGDDTDTSADTLPEDQSDTDPADTADSSSDPADSDVSDSSSDTTDTAPVSDDDPVVPADDDPAPTTDDDPAPTTDNDPDPGEDDPATDALPECNYLSGTPCKDKDTGFVWSSTPSGELSWNGAVDYCDKLTEAGFSWRLPEIYELRTLIENCSYTQVGSACQISKDCLAYSCNANCDSCGIKDGYYSKLNDALMLWSASKVTDYSDYYVWTLNFKYGSFSQGNFNASSDDKYYARCIKK